MRYVFILNPKAGKGDALKKILPKIEAYFKSRDDAYVTHIADSTEKAIEISGREASTGDRMRIFACGGDGTLSAVATGIIGHPNVELGIMPCGSGNDFIKCFGDQKHFLDVGMQIDAGTKRIDVIKCNDFYSVNICSMGMDAMVAAKMLSFKRFPFIAGSFAYQLAVIAIFLGKIGVELKITIDNGESISGAYLFALAANGQYYGGGYQGAPEAVPDDGLLDFVLVKITPRLRIFKLLSIYKAGKHKGLDIVTMLRGKKMEVSSPSMTVVNIDGEVIPAQQIVFEVIPSVIDFIIPKPVIKEDS